MMPGVLIDEDSLYSPPFVPMKNSPMSFRDAIAKQNGSLYKTDADDPMQSFAEMNSECAERDSASPPFEQTTPE